MSIPSWTCARSQVSASIVLLGLLSVVAAMGCHSTPLYLWRGPRNSAKNSAGSS